MKTQIKKLKRIKNVLQELDNTERNVLELPYYEIFGNESERQRDLDVINKKRAMYLDQKYTALETLQIEIEKEKFKVSHKKRALIPLKNGTNEIRA